MTVRSVTPVAVAPVRVASPPTPASARPLKAPITISTPDGEFDHDTGELVVGRGEHAGIVVDDPLVSRTHARVTVRPDWTVWIEDLHSTNGVFVNGVRITGPSRQLLDGDSVLLGTTELGLFSTRESSTMRAAPALALPLEQAAKPAARSLGQQPAPAASATVTTQRAEAFELIGRLADRLYGAGNPTEATRVLSEHLHDVLLGTSAGLSVTRALIEHASRCALKLHEWTRKPSWIDYVFELHLSSHSLPSSATLDLVEPAFSGTSGVDAGLVEYLAHSLESALALANAEERTRHARLHKLADLKK